MGLTDTLNTMKGYVEYHRGERASPPNSPKPQLEDVRAVYKQLFEEVQDLQNSEFIATFRDAPVLDAYEHDSDTWSVPCVYCRDLHLHYAQPGYTDAQCGGVLHLGNMVVEEIESPYKETGYILRKTGKRLMGLPQALFVDNRGSPFTRGKPRRRPVVRRNFGDSRTVDGTIGVDDARSSSYETPNQSAPSVSMLINI